MLVLEYGYETTLKSIIDDYPANERELQNPLWMSALLKHYDKEELMKHGIKPVSEPESG